MSFCAVFTPMSLNKAQFYSKLAPQPSIKLPLMVQTNEWLKCHWHSPGCVPSPAQSADSSQQCAAESGEAALPGCGSPEHKPVSCGISASALLDQAQVASANPFKTAASKL